MADRDIPAGFIPKKLATEKYRRSFRQLTRDLAFAMQAKDEKILDHFRLLLEDGEIIAGLEVTTDEIATLRDTGRNPMWYVRESWMEATYGSREVGSDEQKSAEEGSVPQPFESPNTSASRASDILGLYERQVERFEKEIEWLRSEVSIKNEQIRDANERQRETHLLTRDLHGLMNTLQERLLPAPQATAAASLDSVPVEASSEPASEAPTVTPGTKKRVSNEKTTERETSERPDSVASTPGKEMAAPPSTTKTKRKTPKKPRSFWHRDVREFLSFRQT